MTGNAKTSETGKNNGQIGNSKISDATAVAIANAVVSIVHETETLSFGNELCTTLLGHEFNTTAMPNSPLAACLDRINHDTNSPIRTTPFIFKSSSGDKIIINEIIEAVPQTKDQVPKKNIDSKKEKILE